MSPEVGHRIRPVGKAGLVVAATPVFRASYSGMFKHFREVYSRVEAGVTDIVAQLKALTEGDGTTDV
ncbi:MAG: hypothetical protein HOY79_15720 [Streptomyces sp.]|nr:hypothetical protein [Streptomyces sp.]